MSERVLFFPWGWGGGAAYTGRCLALASELAGAGDEVAFADCGINSMVREAGFTVLESEPEAPRPPDRHPMPSYLPFADVERVFAIAASYHRIERVERRLAADARLIEEYRPTLVVIDMCPTAALAARAARIPVVSLADADFITPRANGWMPWSTVTPRTLLPHPSSLPVWDRVSRELGLGEVSRAEHLLWGEVTLVSSLADLEPVEGPPHRGALHFVGPMYWNPPGAAGSTPPDTDRPKVYVTIGSGGTVGRQALQNVLDACADQPWTVYVSSGFAFEGDLVVPDNVVVAGFTGLDTPLEWADVVVSHGGSATVLATLLHGRPSVVMPFMSEQEMNGRELVDATGAGVLLRTSRTTAYGRLAFSDRYSGPSDQPCVGVADIRRGITEVLGDATYTERAAAWGKRLRARRDTADLVSLAHSATPHRAEAHR
ncbi:MULTISPECIES: nucleotide disphospho-sugar-binding domain-containing protein [unclassified Streptomyces]|uniref:nucleotide disphospho-sugar-binding domain-containing protein n=1 Tax=unclassified Streptomyces TaxID=2593676 RepID=UPI00093B181D|nr:nucleotide disphospho-sugar-binding domain-containing protein [Streptomyces sp. TSRI0281]OKI44932.1 glycosyl transferase [Streptomyces sp. TSRI0281]